MLCVDLCLGKQKLCEGAEGHAPSRPGASVAEGRLWPSSEARKVWRSYLQQGQTTPRAAIALASLRIHAAAFGLLGKRLALEGVARCSLLWDVSLSAEPVDGRR